MSKEEFKDHLFDVLNDTDNLPIRDIAVDDTNDWFTISLEDGSEFSFCVENNRN